MPLIMQKYIFLVIVFIISIGSSVNAQNLLVPTQYSTIQSAINASNNGDTIIISEGVYYENIDFNSKTITISSEYLDQNDIDIVNNTIINGSANGPVVTFNNSEDENSVLEGLTITNGLSTDGGGIFVGDNSSPTLKDLIIRDNVANQFGGGVYIGVGASPKLSRCLISNNQAIGGNGNGGGIGMIALLNEPYLENITLVANSATESGSGIYMNTSGGDQAALESKITLNSCILWNRKLTGLRNSHEELSVKQDGSTPYGDTFFDISYSLIRNGWTGTGNILDEPEFINSGIGDYNLQSSSPCLNTGDPNLPFDSDNTRSDMGSSMMLSFVYPPSIISLTPSKGTIGTSLTIQGTRFDVEPSNNIVYFGAVEASVTSATETTSTITVPAGASFDPISILVNGKIAYSNSPFTVTFDESGQIDSSSFNARQIFSTGFGSYSVAKGDFDGDGKADLAVANGNSNSVSVLRNNTVNSEDFSFEQKIDYEVSEPYEIEIGEINGDGKLDMIVIGSSLPYVVTFYINSSPAAGVISFDKYEYKLENRSTSIALADLDSDGKSDLVITDGNNDVVSIIRNISPRPSKIDFEPLVDFDSGPNPFDISSGDFDHDGKIDLAISHNGGNNSISILRNNSSSPGIISFDSKIDYQTGPDPLSVAAGDLDGDGLADLAVTSANGYSSSVSTFQNISTGEGVIDFLKINEYATGLAPQKVAIGDLDGDGKLDLAVSNRNNNSKSVSIFKNISEVPDEIEYAEKVDFETGTTPFSVTIADLNNDGKMDLVVPDAGDGTVSIFRNMIGCQKIWYSDNDGDGFGNPLDIIAQCEQPSDYVLDNTDCDDTNANVNSETIWYKDNDGDGFGNPDDSIAQCLQPDGYVINDSDCDDNNPDDYPVHWYKDLDSDGYGNISEVIIQCIQPDGYVLDNTDCNDSDESINPETVWYLDSDSDGFGNPDITLVQCEQPENYVSDSTDCDDSSAEINPETTWYLDNDEDGFGDPDNTLIQCEQPLGYVLSDSDCNDTDSNINPDLIWYADLDNDGYGDPNNILTQCEQPNGFVLDNTDCNDNNSDINPETTWYEDADNDGFGNDLNMIIQCEQPNGYVMNNLDCDDNNADDFPDTWYADIDADGYGDPNNTKIQCQQPAGYILDNTDCNDNDSEINPETIWYQDSDGDGYGNLNISLTQCDQPTGYVLDASDCNDGSTEINPETVWFSDSDGDGFGNPNNTIIQCTQPEGYVLDNTDCNDEDNSLNPETVWYEDGDGDGYGNPNITLIQCEQPTGYVLDNSDCDDGNAAINPEAIWYADNDGDGYGNPDITIVQCDQPEGYVLDNTDCNDEDNSLNSETIWYEDGDGDGYGNPNNILTQCEQPTGYVPDNSDCDDGNAVINPEAVWYADNDGDGYGNPDITIVQCDQPEGYVLDNTDCNDEDNSLNPETVWYEDGDGDGYGNPNSTLTQCAQETGYVLDNSDCDDDNAAINPETVWYADNDEDGYGDTNETLIQCEQPNGYLLDSSDCDDTDSNINPETVWYEDQDADGFGNSDVFIIQCEQPQGYVINNLDCDDTDDTVAEDCILSNNKIAENDTRIYPNPTKGKITVSSINQITQILIISEDGKLLKKIESIKNDNSGIKIDLKGISKSYVLLKIEYLDGSYSIQKVVVRD